MITLYAPRKILRKRAKLRDNNSPEFRLLEKSLEKESIFIETTNKTPQSAVDEIENIINMKLIIKEAHNGIY